MAPEAESKTVKAPQLELRGLDRVPEWFRHFIETNGLTHVLAHLVGLDGDQSRLLHCTADGNLYFEAAAGGAASVVMPYEGAIAPDTEVEEMVDAGQDHFCNLGSAASRMVRASGEGVFWTLYDAEAVEGPFLHRGIVGNCGSHTFHTEGQWIKVTNNSAETFTIVLEVWDL